MHHRELFLTILHIGGLVSRRRAWPLVFPTRLSLDSTLSGDVVMSSKTLKLVSGTQCGLFKMVDIYSGSSNLKKQT